MKALVIKGPSSTDWTVKDIESGISELQKLLGGHLSRYPVDTGEVSLSIYYWEMAKFYGLPGNVLVKDHTGAVKEVLAGTVVVFRDTDDGDADLDSSALDLAHKRLSPVDKDPVSEEVTH